MVFFSQINRCQRFGKRADLIYLDQNRIRHVLGNSLPQKFDIRDKEIVTDQLNLFTKPGGQLFPALPIIFGSGGTFVGRILQRIG